MAEYILGIDAGTTSMKAAVFDHKGNRKAVSVVEYSLITPSTNIVEAEPGVYMDAIETCMKQIRESGGIRTEDITVVGFSVQGETMLFLDGDSKPLMNAIVWMDNRAGEEAEELRAKFGDDLCYQVTGQVSFEANWPAAKVLWLKKKKPEIFHKVRHIVLLEDYIIYLLTGKLVSEGSLLCSTEYWDIRSKKYWPEMLDYLGTDVSYYPEIFEPGEMVGKILPSAAARLGISPDAKIVTGCLDQAAGAVGVGNIRQGMMSENIGAALAICVPTGRLTYDPGRKMPVHYFALPDTYMMHTFTTGGMCLRWFRDQFCGNEIDMQNRTGLDSYYLMDKEAERIKPGSDGLITLPHLQGAMAPDVNLDAKGVFYGATLQHTKAHFIRSIMESLGYIICRNLEAIGAMGLEIDEIRTMGGGSKSDIWNQIKADITGKKLYLTYSGQDTACLGAAILAGTAAGIFPEVTKAVNEMVHVRTSYEPDPENHKIYERQYRKYCLLFRSLSDVFKADAMDERETHKA